MRVNGSAPKGVKYECELTGEPATVQTEINGVTYFYAFVQPSPYLILCAQS